MVSEITIDADDAPDFTADFLQFILEHEVAHALGFGTIWSSLGLLGNSSTGTEPAPDTHFSGTNAIAAFDSAGGTDYTGAKVPVENVGPPGTINTHWRIDIFSHTEMMIGTFLRFSPRLALSAITVESMADLGYTVNAGAADGFSLPPISRSLPDLLHAQKAAETPPLRCGTVQLMPVDDSTLIELPPVPLR